MTGHTHEWVRDFHADNPGVFIATWVCHTCGRWKRRWLNYRGEPFGKAWYSR